MVVLAVLLVLLVLFDVVSIGVYGREGVGGDWGICHDGVCHPRPHPKQDSFIRQYEWF